MKLFMMLLVVLGSSAVWTNVFAESRWQPNDIDSPEVIAAAQAALNQLGPERGGSVLGTDPIALVAGFEGGDIYIEGSDNGGIDIIGLESDTVGVPLDLKGLISDLNANVTGYGYKISLSGDILFEFDKADLKPVATETLQKVVLLAKKENAIEIRVEGHTDSKGSPEYNQELSERRAKSVESWLILPGGIDEGILKSIGLGEAKPVAENTTSDGIDNPEGRAQNRRVDIFVKKSEQ